MRVYSCLLDEASFGRGNSALIPRVANDNDCSLCDARASTEMRLDDVASQPTPGFVNARSRPVLVRVGAAHETVSRSEGPRVPRLSPPERLGTASTWCPSP